MSWWWIWRFFLFQNAASNRGIISASNSTRSRFLILSRRIHHVRAPYPGQISRIFLSVFSILPAIFSSIASSVRKFCPNCFFALIFSSIAENLVYSVLDIVRHFWERTSDNFLVFVKFIDDSTVFLKQTINVSIAVILVALVDPIVHESTCHIFPGLYFFCCLVITVILWKSWHIMNNRLWLVFVEESCNKKWSTYLWVDVFDSNIFCTSTIEAFSIVFGPSDDIFVSGFREFFHILFYLFIDFVHHQFSSNNIGESFFIERNLVLARLISTWTGVVFDCIFCSIFSGFNTSIDFTDNFLLIKKAGCINLWTSHSSKNWGNRDQENKDENKKSQHTIFF